MLDFHLGNCFDLEAMRSDISQRNLQRQLVGTKLTQVHVFLQFLHCGFDRLRNMTNLQLFLSSILRLLVFSMRIIESLSLQSVTFLEERIAHLRLINPERDVPRYAAEGNKITTELVCRPDVPRFSDVLPILLAYVQSRQAPGKPVLWVAHNATKFDVPFLMQEFERCSAQVPADWLFVDSLCLARKLKKSDGKLGLLNLEALGIHYGVSFEGPSHRAMPDVQVLCDIFQNITLGLKLTCDSLMSEASVFYDFRKVSRV